MEAFGKGENGAQGFTQVSVSTWKMPYLEFIFQRYGPKNCLAISVSWGVLVTLG